MGRKLDPMKEIIVTQGANGALNDFMMAVINKGDEVVVFTPTYPVYGNQIEVAGGKIHEVVTKWNGKTFAFDPEELKAALK